LAKNKSICVLHSDPPLNNNHIQALIFSKEQN